MTRTLKGSLLIASMLVVRGRRRRRRAIDVGPTRPPRPIPRAIPRGIPRGTHSGYSDVGSTGYYDGGGGYGMAGGGYYNGGYAGGTAGYPGGYGYDYGRPGYNPGGLGGPFSGLGVRPGLGFGAPGMGVGGGGGGLGGPASGIGVRPGLGAGGLGRGADRPQVLRSPCGGAPAWAYGLARGGVGGGQLMGAAAGYRAAGGVRFAHRPMRPGVTPVTARPSDPVERTRLVTSRCCSRQIPRARRGGGEGTLWSIGVNI